MTEKSDDTGIPEKSGSIKDMVRDTYAAVAQGTLGQQVDDEVLLVQVGVDHQHLQHRLLTLTLYSR